MSVSNLVTRGIGRAGLHLKESSPHILFGAGLLGLIGAGVLACRATLQAEETIDKIQEDVDAVQSMRETSLRIDTPYANKEYYRDLSYVGGRSALELGKLYGPSLVLGGLSVAALTGSHFQLARRNTALTVTLAAVSKAYSAYRVRVRQVVGKDMEMDIYQNIRSVEQIAPDGRMVIAKVKDPNAHSPYARLFDESSSEWEKNAELNRMFLEGIQTQFNNRLRAHGYVFLNEVYQELGIARSTEGQIVGWMWNGDGDDFIDFGLGAPGAVNFDIGHEPRVWLDFNVDGPIHTMI